MAQTKRPLGKLALAAAAKAVGGQAELARKLTDALSKPVSQQWVWNAINILKEVPAEWCLPIDNITDGKITRHDLRPDLYPRETAA